MDENGDRNKRRSMEEVIIDIEGGGDTFLYLNMNIYRIAKFG